MHWALFSTLIYLGVMMPQSGSLLLDLIFNQFSTEMVKQQMVTRRVKYRLLKNQFQQVRANLAAAQDSLVHHQTSR